MKAIVIKAAGGPFELVERDVPEPREDEILVKVAACGVCHGEAVVKEGHFPGIRYPRIPGHEVTGTVVKAGSKAAPWKAGDRVGIGWHGGHCFKCEACRRGEFKACSEQVVTGLSADGGYAEFMVTRAGAAVALPPELDLVEGAPLLCAGRTMFGALRASAAKPGDLVAIHGLGGLGHLGVQYARKLGFKVVAVSRGSDKEARARELGAHVYVDAAATDPAKELQKLGGAQVIVATAPNAKATAEVFPGLARHGHMIVVTFFAEPLPIPVPLLLQGERHLSGFVGGSEAETMKFSVLAGVRPVIERFPLEKAALAYERMMTSKVQFRGVLTVGG